MTSPASAGVPEPRRRGRPPRVRPDQIVQAAIPLFARSGYRNTTIAAIADVLGVTDGLVLHYFDTKRELLEAALAAEDQPASRLFADFVQLGGVAALEALAGWGAHMETHPEATAMMLLLSAESLAEGSEIHGRFDNRYEYARNGVAAAIQAGIDSGEFIGSVDAQHEATAFLAFLDGLRLQWMLRDRQISLDFHTRLYIRHLIDRISTRS